MIFSTERAGKQDGLHFLVLLSDSARHLDTSHLAEIAEAVELADTATVSEKQM